MQYTINLEANKKKRQEFTGTVLVLLETGVAPTIDITVEVAGFGVEELRGVKRGLKMRTPGFTGATLLSAVDCTVEIVVSTADISINYSDGGTVNANIVGTVPVSVTGQPVEVDGTVNANILGTVNANIMGTVPVSLTGQPIAVVPDRGAPGAPVHVVGITYSDAPATAINDNTATAVTDTGAALLAASATRKRARFANIGPDPVTLGTTGHTWAKRCIVLEVGDIWAESDAANLAWMAITETGKTASVTVQEVMA